MWATHRVHHSPTKFNLTAAIRVGWTGNISGNFLFFLPLVWIGFHPFAVVTMLGINLIYQFLIAPRACTAAGSARVSCSTRRRTIACIMRRTRPASTRITAAY